MDCVLETMTGWPWDEWNVHKSSHIIISDLDLEVKDYLCDNCIYYFVCEIQGLNDLHFHNLT